jgi:hypothetical protein
MKSEVEKVIRQAIRDHGAVSGPLLQRLLKMKYSEAMEAIDAWELKKLTKKVSNNSGAS